MGEPLNLFPQRAAIGQVDATGRVYMTLEFTRALAALLVRVGGTNGNDLGEVALELATHANAAGLALGRGLVDLELQLAQAVQLGARLAELRKQVAALESQLVQVAPPTDWEHPGKIGAAKASSGQFTTLEATDKVKLSPADKDVEIKPTGAGIITIKAAQAGSSMDNMQIGTTTPRSARVSTLNNLTITEPPVGGGATLTLDNTVTFRVKAGMTLDGTAGATLNIGGGGTLGSAAYVNSGAFAARSTAALAGVATDAATTQALANSLRGVLLSVGIGT